MTDELAKARRERYKLRHPDRVAESHRRYRQTDASRERNRRYGQTDAGRASHRAAVAADSLDRKNARQAVTRAVARGLLVKGPCAVCGSPRVQGHHHKGYAEHRLDVVWLCPLHHKQTHLDSDTPPPASPRQGEPVDVERLARALHEAEVCLNWSPGYGYLDEHNEFHDDHGPAEHTEAARIVAAYAALSEPAEASEP